MVFDPSVLDNMSREELIAQARVLGAERAELLTRVELRDEIVRRSATDVVERQRLRGFLGVARDLVANVVEAGLNLPEAAARIRGETPREEWKGPTPVATVTLAEIYVAQGHADRALTLLDQILSKEPDHEVARELKVRLLSEDREASKRRAPRAETSAPEAESTPVSASAPLSESAPDLSAPPEPAPAPAPVQEIPPPPGPNPAQPVASSAAAQAPSVATLSSADGSLYVYWEVPESLLERGLALVRVATFRARGSSVEQTTRDLPVTTAQGG
ncbi:MAG TPA: tetratricopeptide repeat protein, partial [Polyangiaceae bacterium]